MVTGPNDRSPEWETHLQKYMAPFYEAVELGNRGARVRRGLSHEEGSSAV